MHPIFYLRENSGGWTCWNFQKYDSVLQIFSYYTLHSHQFINIISKTNIKCMYLYKTFNHRIETSGQWAKLVTFLTKKEPCMNSVFQFLTGNGFLLLLVQYDLIKLESIQCEDACMYMYHKPTISFSDQIILSCSVCFMTIQNLRSAPILLYV